MNDQLTQLSLMLKTEQDILELCLQSATHQPIHNHDQIVELIEATISKIKQELRNIDLMKVKANPDKDQQELLILRVNKILLQNERIFACNQQFKDVVKKVVRIYSKDEEVVRFSPPLRGNTSTQFYVGQSQWDEMKTNKSSSLKSNIKYMSIQENDDNHLSRTHKSSSILKSNNNSKYAPQPHQPELHDFKVINQNMMDIKSDLQDLHHKTDTHQHIEYEDAIKKIQIDNAMMLAECHLIKNDNTELLHAQNDIKKRLDYVELDNNRLEQEINQMKIMFNRLIQSKMLSGDEEEQQ